MRKRLRIPLDDVWGALERIVATTRPRGTLIVVVVALVATWFVYVPVHELLHVAGCVAAGGSVSRLDIAPQYGAALLARWFPFVSTGSDYAGQLSGFDTKGSDWIYLSTCFAPFVLSIAPGVLLLRWCSRKPRPVLFGAGIVIGLAPFYNLIGDYYEMGSIITTRVVTQMGSVAGRVEPSSLQDHRTTGQAANDLPDKDPRSHPIAFAGLRSDDVFKLVGTWIMDPAKLGLSGKSERLAAGVLIIVGLAVGLVLALATYLLGDLVARRFVKSAWKEP